MKQIRIASLLCATSILMFAPPSYGGQSTESSGGVNTPALLARLRILLASTPVQTDAFVEQLLTGPLATTFDRNDDGGSTGVRQGTTNSGLPIAIDVSTYPDGFREVNVSVGPGHVISLQDVNGLLANASLAWLEGPDSASATLRHLYKDAYAARQASEAWEQYCADVSRRWPELPGLDLPERYRRSFTALYEKNEGGVFGTFCGVAGIPPDGRVAQMQFAHDRRATALRYILRSRALSSQLYAAEALLVLKQSGYGLNRSDGALIERLRRESQMVEVCSGCESGTIRAGEVFSRFSVGPLRKFVEDFKNLGYLD